MINNKIMYFQVHIILDNGVQKWVGETTSLQQAKNYGKETAKRIHGSIGYKVWRILTIESQKKLEAR